MRSSHEQFRVRPIECIGLVIAQTTRICQICALGLARSLMNIRSQEPIPDDRKTPCWHQCRAKDTHSRYSNLAVGAVSSLVCRRSWPSLYKLRILFMRFLSNAPCDRVSLDIGDAIAIWSEPRLTGPGLPSQRVDVECVLRMLNQLLEELPFNRGMRSSTFV